MNYILDVAKWRCGRDGENSLGDGGTYMRNPQGFMCCLGQFASQMNVTDTQLTHESSPSELYRHTDVGVYDSFLVKENGCDSHPAWRLMELNDRPDTTPQVKIALIRELLENSNHTLEVLNEDLLTN